jgi:hypothetical protein
LTVSKSPPDVLAERDGASAGFVVAAAIFTFAALAIGYHLPPQKGEMGVVFAPWVDQVDAIRAIVDAGGRIAATGRFPNIVIAYASDEAFTQRVTAQGAWFVAAARGLCAPAMELPS